MRQELKKYFELTKPRITIMVLLTAYLGYYMGLRSQLDYSSNWSSYTKLVYLLIGTWFTSSSASIFNQIIEWKQDSKMLRTQNRPLVKGYIKKSSALIFGGFFFIIGVLILYVLVNPITALISIITVFLYIFVYTPSKKITTWNIY